MAATALAVVFGIVLGIYLMYRGGGWALNRGVYDNPAFAIQTIDIQTDGVISTEELRRWAGVRIGQNLFRLDLARVKRDLELIPIVHSASVEKIIPGTVRIRVLEREPVARIQVPRSKPQGGVEFAEFQLDTGGFVLLPPDARTRNPANTSADPVLPMVVGLGGNEVQTGRRVENAQALAAVRLILAFEHSPMSGLADLRTIDVASPEVLVVTTGQGSEVTFSLKDLDQQLRRWRMIFDRSARLNQAIATVDLAVSNSIPVRLVEASTAPAPAPKLPKPTRTRKNHV